MNIDPKYLQTDDDDTQELTPVVVVAMIRPRSHKKGLAVMPQVIKGSRLYENLLKDGYKPFEEIQS